MSLELFAGLRVRDFETARPWYQRLLGEPSFLPHDKEAVWTLADGRHVYIVEEGPEHAKVTYRDPDGNEIAFGGAPDPP